MAVYLGYYHLVPAFIHEAQTRARAGDTTPDPAMMRKAIELPDKLPAGCRLLGAYTPHGMAVGEPDSTQPAVMLVDTANPADLNFISQYYAGFISFRWTPATAVGATRGEREATVAALNAAAGSRG